MLLGSLSMRVFETRTATGSELFSLLTCVHTTTFTLLNIFYLLKKISTKIWETPLPWHAKRSLPVAVRVSKRPCLSNVARSLRAWPCNSYSRDVQVLLSSVIQMYQPQEQMTLCFDSQWGSGWHKKDNRWRQRYLRYRNSPTNTIYRENSL